MADVLDDFNLVNESSQRLNSEQNVQGSDTTDDHSSTIAGNIILNLSILHYKTDIPKINKTASATVNGIDRILQYEYGKMV